MSNIRHFDSALLRVQNEAVASKLLVKVLVVNAMVVIINIGVLTLTNQKRQCQYPDLINREIDQAAASFRVELMINVHTHMMSLLHKSQGNKGIRYELRLLYCMLDCFLRFFRFPIFPYHIFCTVS